MRQTSTEHELMTSKEVATALRLPLPTVYYLAQQGELPGFQVGKRWRFRRDDIERIKQGGAVQRPTVLVLDDDERIGQVLTDALEPAGYDVTTATTVDQGVRAATQTSFDALLVDLVLGDRQGIEFIRAVLDRYSLLQMIIITGHPDLLDTAPLLELGPVTVIRKPFQPSQVVECLAQICARPRAKTPP